MHLSDPAAGRSVLILVPHLQGDGMAIHHHEHVDGPARPAWAPSGDHVACLTGTEGDEQRLTLLSTRGEEAQTLLEPARGEPRFLDGRSLLLEGDDKVERLSLSEAV